MPGARTSLVLQREPTRPSGETFGALYLDRAWFCWTLEDAIREVPGSPVEHWKVNGETAIPEGTYPVALTFSNRFQRRLPELLDVPGFTSVRLHAGNTIYDTSGCPLLGSGRTERTVTGSRVVEQRLMDALREVEDVRLTIRNPWPEDT